VFSAAAERVIELAFREALSRQHAYLTVEHLLYALARDPDGEHVLTGAGADVAQVRAEMVRSWQTASNQRGRAAP